jgi:hypothetical protein
MGVPHDCQLDVEEYLTSIGLCVDTAASIAAHIKEKGTVFEEMGLSKKVAALMNALHTRCWMRIGKRESVVTTFTGGRQGCKLGGSIFNLVYGRMLEEARNELSLSGIVLKLPCSLELPFWSREPDHGDLVQEVVEATFVDDEALTLVASYPAALDAAISVLLEVVT